MSIFSIFSNKPCKHNRNAVAPAQIKSTNNENEHTENSTNAQFMKDENPNNNEIMETNFSNSKKSNNERVNDSANINIDKNSEPMKAKIYHLIILDESGSMSRTIKSTITGCNETLNSIRIDQLKNLDVQEHYVSIYLFQENAENPSHYIVKNVPIAEVRDITKRDYNPCGCTPLYDAVGSTLTDLENTTHKQRMSVANVTIITDGYENASTDYTGEQVARMISRLKELGWCFSFIGAEIDVESVAHSLNIDNHMCFDRTEEGTKQMFAKAQRARSRWNQRIGEAVKECRMADTEELPCEAFKKSCDKYFEEDENLF